MSHKRIIWEFAALIWIGGALCLLRLGTREGYGASDVLCGPWGCLPPTAAMVSMHGFWFMVLLLASGLAAGFLEARRLRQVGRLLALAGLLGTIGFLGGVIFSWQDAYGAMTARIFGRRFLHMLVTSTDWPIVQCGMAGLILLVVCRRLPASNRPISAESEANQISAAAEHDLTSRAF